MRSVSLRFPGDAIWSAGAQRRSELKRGLAVRRWADAIGGSKRWQARGDGAGREGVRARADD